MALTTCKECGREISDQAMTCPGCGAPQAKAKRGGCAPVLGGVLVLIVVLAALGQWDRGGSATRPDPLWKETGRQGTVHFVVVPDTSTSRAAYYTAAERICGTRPHCSVFFWNDAGAAARSIPMSDANLHHQVAQYVQNTTTGHRRWSWNCLRWPETPEPECLQHAR